MPATWQVKTVQPGYAHNKHIYFALFAFISVHLRISIFFKDVAGMARSYRGCV